MRVALVALLLAGCAQAASEFGVPSDVDAQAKFKAADERCRRITVSPGEVAGAAMFGGGTGMWAVLMRGRRYLWRRTKIAGFHARYRSEPCPLPLCLDFHRRSLAIARYANPLKPPPLVRKGRDLQDPELAVRLADEDFGGWSPQIDSMDWLVRTLQADRPRRVLEFGAGRTTACFAYILSRIHGPGGFRILSIDQDPDNVERASKRILGSARESCRIGHAPLVPSSVDGQETVAYDLTSVDFGWLGGQADFVFVDGPWAEGPCRHDTLPKVKAHVRKGARFVLDDALRDKELLAGALWAKDGLKVDGVLTLGQGLLVGRVYSVISGLAATLSFG